MEQDKLQRSSRRSLDSWLKEHAERLKSLDIDDYHEMSMYIVGRNVIIVLDMFSRSNNKYQGFEVFSPMGGNEIEETLSELEKMTDTSHEREEQRT